MRFIYVLGFLFVLLKSTPCCRRRSFLFRSSRIPPLKSRSKFLSIALCQNVVRRASVRISDVDDDGSGTIEYEEFLPLMPHKILNRDSKDEILKAFRFVDDDETGKISFKNLKRVAKELGEGMADEELQEMVDEPS